MAKIFRLAIFLIILTITFLVIKIKFDIFFPILETRSLGGIRIELNKIKCNGSDIAVTYSIIRDVPFQGIEPIFQLDRPWFLLTVLFFDSDGVALKDENLLLLFNRNFREGKINTNRAKVIVQLPENADLISIGIGQLILKPHKIRK